MSTESKGPGALIDVFRYLPLHHYAIILSVSISYVV